MKKYCVVEDPPMNITTFGQGGTSLIIEDGRLAQSLLRGDRHGLINKVMDGPSQTAAICPATRQR
jgi:hypothetical protein